MHKLCLLHIKQGLFSLRYEDVVIVWRSKRTLCYPAGHLDGFFHVSPVFFQAAVSHCESWTNHMSGSEHPKTVCGLFRCVYKLNISWFDAGFSLRCYCIAVNRRDDDEWRLCWTQVEMQMKLAQMMEVDIMTFQTYFTSCYSSMQTLYME